MTYNIQYLIMYMYCIFYLVIIIFHRRYIEEALYRQWELNNKRWHQDKSAIFISTLLFVMIINLI